MEKEETSMEIKENSSMEKVYTSMENQRGNLHGTNSFQDHLGSTDFHKQSFSTISRLKSVASISNDTDPEGKTKILSLADKAPTL